ncbi:MAG: hypothetical protein HRT38_11890 [Alteromonadaceae bacterium]|nr:hypothetical protein [Alteromonadaceae bacterium]
MIDKEIIESSKEMDVQSQEREFLDEQWLALAEDWQSQPYEKVDIQALFNKTRRRILGAKCLLAFDIVVTLAMLVFVVIGFISDSFDLPTLVFLVFGVASSIIYIAYTIKIRLGTWALSEQSPTSVINTAIVGYKSSIKFLKLIKFSTIGMFFGVNIYLVVMNQIYDKPLVGALIFINLTIVVMYASAHYYHVSRQKELEHMKQFETKL